ncbi:MAG TPA: BMP family ABC transporter substrate-binding protein, partial [Anaerolineae bacterium]|nr:BMP family ABC transporter substrate-binding protein [Anaerolineae bacterium]
MSKHVWKLMAVLVVVATLLGACGPAATPAPTEVPAATPVPEFVFGIILVGPYNDHGWSEAHYTAAQYVTEKLPNTRFDYLDKLNSADRPETTLEQVVDDMVSKGARIIFTTSDAFMEDTDRAAEKYPDVTFIAVSGDQVLRGVAPSNVGNLMGRM